MEKNFSFNRLNFTPVMSIFGETPKKENKLSPVLTGFNQVKPVKLEKSKREAKGNKGIYLKGLLVNMTPSEAKEKFLEIYPDKTFGLKRFKIYMNDIQKGRY
jgi:hypothetical protein